MGARAKNKLAVEAETVRLVFRLFVEGDNGSGPKGVKAIAIWLNDNRGMRERLTTGAIPFRKAYKGSIVDRIEVDDDTCRLEPVANPFEVRNVLPMSRE